MARFDDAGLAALDAACRSQETIERWAAKVVVVDGSSCRWWTGALSGRGHGRFWLAPGRVVVAHRFAFALVHGVAATAAVAVLGHRCDNPLCQRVGEGDVVASSHAENRREWAIRRGQAGSPLGDPRGSRQRARELRDLAREDPALVAAKHAELWKDVLTRAPEGAQAPAAALAAFSYWVAGDGLSARAALQQIPPTQQYSMGQLITVAVRNGLDPKAFPMPHDTPPEVVAGAGAPSSGAEHTRRQPPTAANTVPIPGVSR